LNFVGKFDEKLSADSSIAHLHVHVEHPSTHAPADAIIVADAHLLFGADFKRSGVDLILSNSDRELVLHDYFKGDHRLPLASPDGAHLTGDIVNALTGQVEYAQAAGGSTAVAHIIGHVSKLAGSATAIRNGVSIILNQGDSVEKGDVVATGSDSTLGVTFIDGTVFGLSSNARMVLNEMVYDPNGSNNSSLISLVAGTISFVAGETAKHGDMKVDTPVATMGIRGTAVLVEIDFSVPGQNGLPDAKFQVLTEPDGTTGSYILFDKQTLDPIATVNTAGQQVNITHGQVTTSNDPLSPDAQKLIMDLFALKFTSNPQTIQHFTDIGIPQPLQSIQLASGTTVTPFVIFTNTIEKLATSNTDQSAPTVFHIDLAPTVVAFGNTSIENAGTRGGSVIDTAFGTIRFADVNAGDLPTVKATFSSFTLQDGNHNDITQSLTTQQLAEIAAVEASLAITPAAGNTNNGSVSWTYSVADIKLGFLTPGETLTLHYLAEVDTNYAPDNTTVSTPIAITITGLILPTIATTSGAFTEMPASSNAAIDHVGGVITFTDADLTARPTVSTHFTSFSYQDGSQNDITSTLTPQQLADIAAVESPLTMTPSATNTNDGSVAWSYDIVNSEFNFLGADDKLTLTYSATVNDGHGGLVTEPFTVTITGTENPPTIAATSSTFTELPASNNTTIDHAGGTITFADVDLTDRPVVTAQFTSFTYQDVSHDDITSSLSSQQLADIKAVEASLTLTPSATDTNDGSVAWSYDVINSAFNFLGTGDTLTLTYAASVDDGHGGSVTEPFSVTITGTNDPPTIQAETNPPMQAVVAVNEAGLPNILDQGANTNSFGLHTETFDGQTAGSVSNNGAGHGDFFSDALDATFSGSGDAGVVNGTLADVTAAPFIGPLPGSADTTNYLSIGAGGTETIVFANQENAFGLYWGSVDPNNTIDFYNGTNLVAHYTGADISPLFSDGNQGSFSSNGYVEFSGLAPFDTVVLGSGVNSFEIDNISAGSVHAQLADPITGTLTVDEPNFGDTLTASVIGNATIEYNGSTTLPNGLDVNALAAASNIKFDSVSSNGGTETLDWTYDPVNPDLDFLKAGDTLTITYAAQVDNGHGSAGNQPLAITIVGASPAANMSNFQIVSGTTANDTFNNVGNGATIFGGGGQDNFVFNENFKSATIGDFDVTKDAIEISHALFASVSAILAAAQPVNSGHDTIITDAAHDTITLTGVTVAEVQTHASDFHLI
jgi:VCBS repeat-containing protein